MNCEVLVADAPAPEGIALMSMTWRKAIAADVPKFAEMLRNSQTGEENDIFIKSSNLEEVREIRNWIKEFCHGTCKLFGRYSYKAHRYSVDRNFEGLVFRFDSVKDMVYFRLRFATEV